MDLTTIIKERRTIKRFKPEEVDTNIVMEMINTAVYAPNHKLTEPWRFILVKRNSVLKLAEAARKYGESKEKNPDNKAKSGQALYNKLSEKHNLLLVVMNENPNIKTREEDFAATSSMIQNFMLLAWEKGIGTIWATNDFIYSNEFREAAGVKPGEKIVANLMFGYPEVVPKIRVRKNAEELVSVLE